MLISGDRYFENYRKPTKTASMPRISSQKSNICITTAQMFIAGDRNLKTTGTNQDSFSGNKGLTVKITTAIIFGDSLDK